MAKREENKPVKYKIFEVPHEENYVPEEMGSKKKFWYRPPEKEDGLYWLFKYPKENTGEHWAEKIAAEVAYRLGIMHAKVVLAKFQGKRGSATESFVRGGRELVHGNQLLKKFVGNYDPDKRFGQSDHTLENIFKVMDLIFKKDEAKKIAKIYIAGYLILDALVGNTDRHHENWGILRKRVGDGWQGIVAPSFDHASSLGRELLDERRERNLLEKRVGHYAEKGHGGIYWSESDRKAPSPLKLARRGVREYPQIFAPALGRLHKLSADQIHDIISRVPDKWMSQLAKQFACELMLYNLLELRKLIDE